MYKSIYINNNINSIKKQNYSNILKLDKNQTKNNNSSVKKNIQNTNLVEKRIHSGKRIHYEIDCV